MKKKTKGLLGLALVVAASGGAYFLLAKRENGESSKGESSKGKGLLVPTRPCDSRPATTKFALVNPPLELAAYDKAVKRAGAALVLSEEEPGQSFDFDALVSTALHHRTQVKSVSESISKVWQGHFDLLDKTLCEAIRLLEKRKGEEDDGLKMRFLPPELADYEEVLSEAARYQRDYEGVPRAEAPSVSSLLARLVTAREAAALAVEKDARGLWKERLNNAEEQFHKFRLWNLERP